MRESASTDAPVSKPVSSDREPAGVRLTPAEALAFGERALRRIGYEPEVALIIATNLVDAELCGYDALGLTRIITLAEHPYAKQPRKPVSIVRETPVSAVIDGGNYVGLYAMYRATEVAIDKARTSRFALVGLHNSYLSGRNSYFLELVGRAGFVGIHLACSQPVVAPLGGRGPAFGTNPIAFGVPGDPDPVIFDMGTAATNHGDLLHAVRLGHLLPENTAIDADGRPTRDPAAALAGAILTFGGHKGHGLSFMVQALGLLAGAASVRGEVQDFGFLLLAFDPGLLMPAEQFKEQLARLIERVKATPRQPGVEEILIPSERAFRTRRVRRVEGIVLKQAIHDRIAALSSAVSSSEDPLR